MVIGAVQAGAWEQLSKPVEDRLVPYMHPEGDLRVFPIPAKVPLADKQACDEAPLDICDLAPPRLVHAGLLFTGGKNT